MDVLQQYKDYVAILIGIIGAFTGVLAYYNQKKEADSKGIDTLIQNALKLADQVGPLSKRIDELELENADLRIEINAFKSQKKILEDKMTAMEIAILESPLYRKFFEFATFPCVVFNPNTGEIINANSSFISSIGTGFKPGFSFFSSILNLEYLRKNLDNETSVIRDVFISSDGSVINAKLAVVYAMVDDKPVCLGVASVHGSSTMEARAQDLLCQITSEYKSDYATIWAIHKNGIEKMSAVYECAASGNEYLFHNYRDIPLYAYEEMFEQLNLNNFVFIRVDDGKMDSVRSTMRSAGLKSIFIYAVYKDNKVSGMISTSWKRDVELDEINIDKIKTYANSNLLQDLLAKFV